MTQETNRSTQSQIIQTFSLYRGLILDAVEIELGESKNWSYVRSRLLKILSNEKGLEAKIIEILQGCSK